MPEIIQIGPVLIQMKWIYFILALFASYMLLRRRLDQEVKKPVIEALENSFILGILVWKLSVFVIEPSILWKNFLGILYFSGGEKGIFLGTMAGLVSFLFFMKKKQLFTDHVKRSMIEAYAIFLFLRTIFSFFESGSSILVNIMYMMTALGLFYLARRMKSIGELLLWLSSVMIVIDFFEPIRSFLWLGLSANQAIFTVIALFSFVIKEDQHTETNQVVDYTNELNSRVKRRRAH